MDLTFTTACIADVVSGVEIASLYKFKGLPPSEPSSFRGVGLAPGLLALISDAMHIRCAPFYAAAAMDTQLGGRRDGRFQVIAAWEKTNHRRAMVLATVDIIADAKGGYDGGRHGQLMKAAKHAAMRPREWLLLYNVYGAVRIHMRCRDNRGAYAVLGAIPKGSGGKVQGLSISGCSYGAVPMRAAAEVASKVPPPLHTCTSRNSESIPCHQRQHVLGRCCSHGGCHDQG